MRSLFGTAIVCSMLTVTTLEFAMADEPTDFTMRLRQLYFGGVVTDAGTAERLAVVLISSHYGEAELAQQMPLQVTDVGEAWKIVGSRRAEGRPGDLRLESGLGPVTVVINKSDARVIDLRIECRMVVDPDVELAIRKSARQKE